MLIIGRKVGESLTVRHGGEAVQVVLTRSRHGGLAIGVEGPRSFVVVRDDAKPVAEVPHAE